ncbi:MAG: HEPN domain-containing protein [Pyrobaculum sp.]
MVEKFWLDKAREFLQIAREATEAGHYWLACFSAQQAVEFLLEGIRVKYTGSCRFTHDLSTLLDDVARLLNTTPPQEIYLACDLLTPHYTLARYSHTVDYDRRKAEQCVTQATKVFQWAETVK